MLELQRVGDGGDHVGVAAEDRDVLARLARGVALAEQVVGRRAGRAGPAGDELNVHHPCVEPTQDNDRRGDVKNGRLRRDNWRRDVFMAILGAVLTILAGIASQRATVAAQQAALRELIRVELAQNARSLSRSSSNLRSAASELENFLSDDSPAPPLAAGYLGLATVGLRTQLEDPSVFRADHRILALYSIVYGRLVRFMEVQRTLDAAAIQYRAALNPEDRLRAAAHLNAVIRP